jgi:tRNA(Ile)-lysidine synthase
MLPVTPLADYRLVQAGNSDSPASDVRLIRPLLQVPRAEIEAYCAYHGLVPQFDRSNLDRTYFRNWLRHEVLPLLASHNPNIHEVIHRSARVVADDYELLRWVLTKAWGKVVCEETSERIAFGLDAWRGLPVSLQRSTVREAVKRLRRSLRDVSFVHVENAVEVARSGPTGAQSTLPGGLVLTLEYDRLVLASAGAAPMLPDWPLLATGSDPVPVNVPGIVLLPGSAWLLDVQVIATSRLPRDWEANRDRWRAFLDASEAGRRLMLRTRKDGDRFQPLGMGGRTAKLSDFLTNRKVPHAVRDRLPLLVSEAGIVWVCGQRPDERARIRASTKEVLLLRFVREAS